MATRNKNNLSQQISGPPVNRATTHRAKTPPFVVPNLCQTSALLILVLVSECCVLAWVLANQSFSWATLGLYSIAVQWIALTSAACLCALRPYLSLLSLRLGWLLCFLVIEGVGLLVVWGGPLLLQQGSISAGNLLQSGLAIAIIAAMILRFFQLLQQSIDHNQAELAARMEVLQARIKPHFLFNSLGTIAELIVSRPHDAELAVENLSALFRANLKEASSFCTLEQEIELVKGYLALEQWRLGERLKLHWEISAADMSWPVPVLCLQPLAENAVLYGAAAQTEGGTVTIKVLQTPRVTTLVVENSIGQLPLRQGHGIGLDNIQKRLLGLYGPNARCRIEKTATDYRVILTLPKTSPHNALAERSNERTDR